MRTSRVGDPPASPGVSRATEEGDPNPMSKIMLVNVTHVEESRVAILNDGVLEAYEIETINRAQLKGNIYNAVVENVHPTLEAAFLKLTPELKGFLPLDEVNFQLLPARGESRKSGRIGQHLHQGQRLLAQVVREPFAGKPPSVSTYFSLPGRYLVLMPGVASSGVSRKIEDSEHRERLLQIVHELAPPEGFGVIVRTAGLGQTKAELQGDLRYLLRLWQSVQRASGENEFPALVYREADLVIRTMRDHFGADIGEVWIDSKETFDKTHAFVRSVMPTRVKTLRLYTGDRPLFNRYNLEEQIESIYQRRVSLPSGGEIVIDGTEALTAIDVNSARAKRRGDAEETALQTNLEAAAEIARQMRLRDLAGLIVIDFIDMAAAKYRKRVEDAMREAMRGDRAKHDVTRLSKLGLMEIARQRLRGAKIGSMYTACPTCEGYGLIKNLEAAALSALRKLQTRAARGGIGRIRVGLPVEVATWMLNHKRDDLVAIESRHNLRIDIVPAPSLLRHQTEFEALPREQPEVPPTGGVPVEVRPFAPAELLAPEPEPEVEPEPAPAPRETRLSPAVAAETAAAPGEAAPRRRRRRRRRSGAAPGTVRAEGAETSPAGANGELPFGASPVSDGPLLPDFYEQESDAQPAAALEEPTPEPPDAAAEGSLDPEGQRRKRRRRRRGRRGRAEGATSAPPEAPDAASVPRGVHSDELMPAAVGGSAGGRSRRRRRGRRGGSSPAVPDRRDDE